MEVMMNVYGVWLEGHKERYQREKVNVDRRIRLKRP
jgi:hypothetical protein